MLWNRRKPAAEVPAVEEELAEATSFATDGDSDDLPTNEVAVAVDGESAQEDDSLADEAEESSADPETGEPSEEDADETDLAQIQYLALKEEIHRQVIGEIDLSRVGSMREEELRIEIRRATERILAERAENEVTGEERDQLIDEVIDETFGLGPLEALFRDDSISEIMINGSRTIFVEKKGRLQRSPVRFANEEHLLKIIQRIVSGVGRRVDETSPMVDARLADGSRVNAIIPPLALDGSLVSIRRFGSKPLQASNLIEFDSITPEMVEFLKGCVAGRLNILVSGGTGSGKTTLLNVLSSFIPHDERVATIEDSAELQLQQPHVIRMETRPPNIEGKGEVTIRDLVKNALRMRPDRIIVGECRGSEALDMLQAMNTGHEGSLTTIHANTPRDAIRRLEMMVGMTGFDLPMWTIRQQISSAIQMVVQVVRMTGGARKIVGITEVTGMEGDVITMHDVFSFKRTGLDENRRAQGYFMATGIRPHFLERLEGVGVKFDPSMFEERMLTCS